MALNCAEVGYDREAPDEGEGEGEGVWELETHAIGNLAGHHGPQRTDRDHTESCHAAERTPTPAPAPIPNRR